MSGNPSAQTGLFDVTEAIDRRFSPLQRNMYLLAALAMILDGFDGQLIGFAIPAIMKEWGVTREAFSTAVASGLFGMAIGSMIAGYIADRIGRRLLLVCSVFLFGGATMGMLLSVPLVLLALFFVREDLLACSVGGLLADRLAELAEAFRHQLRRGLQRVHRDHDRLWRKPGLCQRRGGS